MSKRQVKIDKFVKRSVRRRLNFDDDMASNEEKLPKPTKTLYVIQKGSSSIMVNVEGCHGEEETLTMKKASPQTVRDEAQYAKFFEYLDTNLENNQSTSAADDIFPPEGFVIEPPLVQSTSAASEDSQSSTTLKKKWLFNGHAKKPAGISALADDPNPNRSHEIRSEVDGRIINGVPEPGDQVSLFCDEIMEEEEIQSESVVVAVQQQVSKLREIIKLENAKRVVDEILFTKFIFSVDQLSALISACFEIFSVQTPFTQEGIDLFRDDLIKSCISMKSDKPVSNVYVFLMSLKLNEELGSIRDYFIYMLFERRKVRTGQVSWAYTYTKECLNFEDFVTEIDLLEYRDARLFKSSSVHTIERVFTMGL